MFNRKIKQMEMLTKAQDTRRITNCSLSFLDVEAYKGPFLILAQVQYLVLI